jgi:hypothetical protein
LGSVTTRESAPAAGEAQLFGYKPTKLEIREQLSIQQWRELLENLAAMDAGLQWWIGDALVYGEQVFEEELFIQVSSEVGLEPATLVNYRWVASSVHESRRREELSFSHHAEVARLKPTEQEKMLKRAIAEAWSVRELRVVVALEHPQNGQQALPLEDDRDPPASVEDAEQKRLEKISLAFESEGLKAVTPEDVAFLLELARRLTRGGRR